jgi:hypothetical protein
VAKKAEELEAAARREDMGFIATNNGKLIEEAAALLKSLEGLLADMAGQEGTKPLSKSPDAALLAELSEACKQYKTNHMEAILGQLESFQYESGGDLVAWLREQVDNLEYDAITERLEQLSVH